MQETELIQQLKEGRESAFRRLVEAHKDRVYNTCLGFLHNPEDAEDTAQEVFMQVYESIDSFREDASLATWIYRIAVTKSLELLRRRKRTKRYAFFQAMFNIDAEPDDVKDDDFFVHPGLALEQKERAEVLMAAVEKLPENQRVAFTLNKFEQLSYKEIAQVMETSLSAVESLLHRAKKNLQDLLFDYYKDQM